MDLSDPSQIVGLKPRYAPYWQTLEYCRHLGVQVHPNGGVFWVARVRTRGGSKYAQHRLADVALPRQRGAKHAEALELARRWFEEPEVKTIAANSYPVGVCRELRYSKSIEGFTVGDAMRDYVEWKRLAAAKTHFETNLSLVNFHIIPRLGNTLASDLKPRDITAFVRDVLETPPKYGNQELGSAQPLSTLDEEALRKRKKTANTLLGILRLALQMAWENGEIESSKCWRSIRRLPHRDAPRNIFLSRSECAELLSNCRDDLKRLVLGALYTGCRVSELCAMVVGDFDRDATGVHVAPGKSRYRRFVTLPSEGVEFFETQTQHRHRAALLFMMASGKAWNGNHKHLFKSAVRNAGLPERFVFHGLRHTYASQLVRAGLPMAMLAKQLGHANTDTISRTYGHLSIEDIGNAVDTRFTPIAHTELREGGTANALFQDDSWPRSNFSRATGEILHQIGGGEFSDRGKI